MSQTAPNEIYYIILTALGTVLSFLFSFVVWILKRYLADFDDIKKNVAEINGKISTVTEMNIVLKEHDRSLLILDNSYKILNQRVDDILMNGRAHQ
jgi:cell division protein FtsB